MNFLKRLYLLLLTVALIVVVVLFLLAPGSVSSWVSSMMEAPVLLRVLVTLVIGLVLGAVTGMQIQGERKNRLTGLMMRAGGAITEVSVESARGRILKAVSDLPDVASAEAQIKPIRGRADIEMHVTVFGHDVQLPAKQKEINRALNQVLNKQLGLRMAGKPRVHIQIYGEQSSPAPVQPPQPENTGLVGGLLGGLRRDLPVSEPPTPTPAVETRHDPVPKVIAAEPEAPVERESAGKLLGAWRRERQADEPAAPASVTTPSDLDVTDVKMDDFQPIKLDSDLAQSPTTAFVDDTDDVDEELGVRRSVSDIGDMPEDGEPEAHTPDVPAKD